MSYVHGKNKRERFYICPTYVELYYLNKKKTIHLKTTAAQAALARFKLKDPFLSLHLL